MHPKVGAIDPNQKIKAIEPVKKNPNPPNKPTNNQSIILLSLKPFHKYRTVNAQKGIKQMFTLNSGVVKL